MNLGKRCGTCGFWRQLNETYGRCTAPVSSSHAPYTSNQQPEMAESQGLFCPVWKARLLTESPTPEV